MPSGQGTAEARAGMISMGTKEKELSELCG
jgi:hypothetical protein